MSDYKLGMPNWFELGTTDQAAAKQFYGELFGWTYFDAPTAPGESYTMFKLDGRDVGATYTLPKTLLDQGVKPHWNVYFAAPELDAVAAKVPQLGGTLIHPPFDVMDQGRMSICRDPGGAMFSLWQAKKHHGAVAARETNAVGWVELATWDVKQANEFYTGLFGWETKGSANMATYLEFSTGGHPLGGLLPMDDNWKGMPSHWGIYIQVADCDAVVAKAKAMGGTLLWGPHDAPGVGKFAAISDPQGAAFHVITLKMS